MKVIDQSYEILTSIEQIKVIPQMIELTGRICYKSENRIIDGSADEFCRMLIKRGHKTMIEHGNITVRFITVRGVTHELVRHRLASFAQESTRYVTDGDIEFIRPVFNWANKDPAYLNHKWQTWITSMSDAETAYKRLLSVGCPPQEARTVLPNSLKTEIVVTCNIREWRHLLKLRTAKSAHPQIRALMLPLLKELQELVPVLFEDIGDEL